MAEGVWGETYSDDQRNSFRIGNVATLVVNENARMASAKRWTRATIDIW
jgi:hypothetical protein